LSGHEHIDFHALSSDINYVVVMLTARPTIP
jgi:hypothetical protein